MKIRKNDISSFGTRFILNGFLSIFLTIIIPTLIIVFNDLPALTYVILSLLLLYGLTLTANNLFNKSKYQLISYSNSGNDLLIDYYKYNKNHKVSKNINKLRLQVFRHDRAMFGFKLMDDDHVTIIKLYSVLNLKENKTIKVAEKLIQMGIKTDDRSKERINNSKEIFRLNR